MNVESIKHGTYLSFYLLFLFIIFGFLVLQGPIANPNIDPNSASILADALIHHESLRLSFLDPDTAVKVEYIFQLVFGFISCYLLGRTFQKMFDSGPFTSFWVIMIFLSPYFAPFVFGEYLINNGYSYPFFLMNIRFLLNGLVFRNRTDLVLFFTFCSVNVILRRQFIFLPVVGIFATIYALAHDYDYYYGRKALMVLALASSFLVPELTERAVNFNEGKGFISKPYVGVQFSILPLYLSKEEDSFMFEDSDKAEFFEVIRQRLSEQKLTLDGAQEKRDELELMGDSTLQSPYQTYKDYFRDYPIITYDVILPLLKKLNIDRPHEFDEGLVEIALTLMGQHMSTYIDFFLHNMIYHMGGHFLFLLMMLVLMTSWVYHLQYRGRFSLVSGIISITMVLNFVLVAFIEPVTRQYAFYTDVLWQALIVSLLSFLFRDQRGKLRVDDPTKDMNLWRRASAPAEDDEYMSDNRFNNVG